MDGLSGNGRVENSPFLQSGEWGSAPGSNPIDAGSLSNSVKLFLTRPVGRAPWHPDRIIRRRTPVFWNKPSSPRVSMVVYHYSHGVLSIERPDESFPRDEDEFPSALARRPAPKARMLRRCSARGPVHVIVNCRQAGDKRISGRNLPSDCSNACMAYALVNCPTQGRKDDEEILEIQCRSRPYSRCADDHGAFGDGEPRRPAPTQRGVHFQERIVSSNSPKHLQAVQGNMARAGNDLPVGSH